MQAEPEKQKRCGKCKEEKALTEFHKDSSKKDGLQGMCKACSTAYRTKRYAANRDRELEYNIKWNEANRNKRREYYAKWRKANPDKVRANNHRRRARKAEAEGTFTADQWKERLAYHGYKCIYCGVEKQDTPQKYLTMEHLIPLCRGGSNWPSNLAPSCTSCNSRKNTKTHFEYLEHLNAQKEI